MTEQEWLACQDSGIMIKYLLDNRHLVSDRKLQLFGIAYVRILEDRGLLTLSGNHEVIIASESFADGKLGKEEMSRFISSCEYEPRTATEICRWIIPNPKGITFNESLTQGILPNSPPEDFPLQARLLRCIVGNPFRKTL